MVCFGLMYKKGQIIVHFSALSYTYNGVDIKLDMLRITSNLVSGSIMIYMYCLDELNITDSEMIVNKNDNCFQKKKLSQL